MPLKPCPNCGWMCDDTITACNMCGRSTGFVTRVAPPNAPLDRISLSVVMLYHDADEPSLRLLEAHLDPLRRTGLLTIWHRGKLLPGANQLEHTQDKLRSAHLVLLLVSADFNAAWDTEWDTRLFDALQHGPAYARQVVPVVLRPCAWSGLPFYGLQPIPKDGRPLVVDGKPVEERFASLTAELKAIATAHQDREHQPGPTGRKPPSALGTPLVRVLSEIEAQRRNDILAPPPPAPVDFNSLPVPANYGPPPQPLSLPPFSSSQPPPPPPPPQIPQKKYPPPLAPLFGVPFSPADPLPPPPPPIKSGERPHNTVLPNPPDRRTAARSAARELIRQLDGEVGSNVPLAQILDFIVSSAEPSRRKELAAARSRLVERSFDQCAFCGQPRDVAEKLVIGPQAAACVPCITACVDTITDDEITVSADKPVAQFVRGIARLQVALGHVRNTTSALAIVNAVVQAADRVAEAKQFRLLLADIHHSVSVLFEHEEEDRR